MSRYGAIAKSLPFTCGKIFFVVSNSDAHFADFQNAFPVDSDGVQRVHGTIQAALDLVVSGRNDVIVLDSNTAHAQTAMLTISKSRVHFVGVDSLIGDNRKYGPRARITMGVTTAVTDVFLVKNTGVGNSFRGIKFDSGNTLTQAVGTFGEGGEYTRFQNCEFYNSAKLNSDTQAELILNGDSAQFENCTFGSLADAVSGNKIRPAVLLTKATVGAGLVSRDVLFDNCRFWKQAGGATTAFVKGAATDVERVMEFHNCQFVANPLGSTPAVAIDVATLTVGSIILTGDTCAFTCTKIGTATGIFSGLSAKVVTATIGVQAS